MNDKKTVVYSNTTYEVVLKAEETRHYYVIINKDWGVEEGEFKDLPSAISIANQMNDLLRELLYYNEKVPKKRNVYCGEKLNEKLH